MNSAIRHQLSRLDQTLLALANERAMGEIEALRKQYDESKRGL